MTTTLTPRSRRTRNTNLALAVTFDRIGAAVPVARRGRGSVAPVEPRTLSIIVPPNTAADVSATVGRIAADVHRFVRMFIDADQYSVTVDYDGGGHGRGAIDDGALGTFTIAPAGDQ